jgi:hypothetical protein
MIDPAVLLTLETRNEMRVAVFLATSTEPMRLKDIVEDGYQKQTYCLSSSNCTKCANFK